MKISGRKKSHCLVETGSFLPTTPLSEVKLVRLRRQGKWCPQWISGEALTIPHLVWGLFFHRVQLLPSPEGTTNRTGSQHHNKLAPPPPHTQTVVHMCRYRHAQCTLETSEQLFRVCSCLSPLWGRASHISLLPCDLAVPKAFVRKSLVSVSDIPTGMHGLQMHATTSSFSCGLQGQTQVIRFACCILPTEPSCLHPIANFQKNVIYSLDCLPNTHYL